MVMRSTLSKNCLFLLPAVILLGTFAIYPVFQALWMSLTNIELLKHDFDWIGFENFKRLFHDSNFFSSLEATLGFVGGSVLLQYLMGMVGALTLNRAKIRSVRLFRSALILPYTLSELVVGILWLRILDSEFGMANALVYYAGGEPQAWLFDWAMPAAILVNVWWGSVFSLLLFEAALKGIPEEWYESARVDGASGWYQFRHITLPALKYVTFLDLVYISLFTINTFGIIFVLTFGGPGHETEVLGLFMWKQAFRDYKLGYGASISVVIFAINIFLAIFYLRLFGRQVLVEERF
ncbi:MAG: carbohydrate ABC transporter permease [Thermodesulfobacteriota bacterium]